MKQLRPALTDTTTILEAAIHSLEVSAEEGYEAQGTKYLQGSASVHTSIYRRRRGGRWLPFLREGLMISVTAVATVKEGTQTKQKSGRDLRLLPIH